MKTKNLRAESENVASVIHTIRGQKVILDADLARIYTVPVFRFNEAVKRNAERFPEDFRFQLTFEEWEHVQRLRSQIAILKKGRGRHRKYLPYAFTEHGAIMAANVLNSKQAVRMSVFVVRAFLKMRELLVSTTDLAQQLRELEAKLTARLDIHETAIVEILQRLMHLLDPPIEPKAPQPQIGFLPRPEPPDDTATRRRFEPRMKRITRIKD